MKIRTKGYIMGAVASAAYGTNPLFALPLFGEGMDSDSILFFRYLLAIPMMAALMLIRKESFAIKPSELPLLAAMGLLVATSSLTLFESLRFMDAGIASTMLFVYPVMVALIMTAFFGERLTMRTLGCLALTVAGVVLLYRQSDGATISAKGSMLVMVSALAYALYIVGVNRSRLKEMNSLKITFYALLAGMSAFAVRTGFGEHLVMPCNWQMWIDVGGLALFSTALSFAFITMAIHYIGSTPTAILGALEPVTAIIIGVMVFGEHLTPRIVCGVVLIIAAVTMVVAGGAVSQRIKAAAHYLPRLHRHSRG
ncbi:MAG: DMT family transporter [Alistipes sp.]|nr:DMT family transporter [Alistipes sp.]